MGEADDTGGGGRRSSSLSFTEVNRTVERLNASKTAVQHPARFMLDRLHTIELWWLSGRKLNLLQLGTSLVRGLLRRSRHGDQPLRMFDPLDTNSFLSSSSSGATGPSTSPGWVLHAGSSGHEKAAEREAAQHQVAQTTLSASVSAHGNTTPPRHRHVHHREGTATPSVARIVLVHAASDTPSELFMGVLVGLFSHGVSSMVQRDEHPTTTATTATPSSASLTDHLTHMATAATTFRSAHAPQPRLSSEAAHALHEVHRAAREIIQLMHADVAKLCVLFNEAVPEQARVVQHDEADSRTDIDHHVPQEAATSTVSAEVQVHELCLRLTHLSANLYTVVAFLDFFSVEAEVAEKRASADPPTRAAHGGGAGEATTTHPPTKVSEKCSKGLAPGFSSAVAAVASDIADHSSQAAGTAAGIPDHRNSGTSSSTTASSVNPLHPRSAPAAESSTRGALPQSAAAAHHGKAVYTVEHFHTLFDTAGHLPQCVWDVFAAATAVLSQCGVSWSLTHGDAAVTANFNATAAVMFSAAQLSLLRQLHRLCRRFELLRQRVYALYPVSPVRFKVKQMLDWADFLHASDAMFRSTHDGYADLVDLHDDELHKTYPLRPRWAVTASNRRVLQRVAAIHYTTPAPRRREEEGAKASSPPSLFPRSVAAEMRTGDTTVSLLLATLTSVGTSSCATLNRGRAHGALWSTPSSHNNKGSTHPTSTSTMATTSAAIRSVGRLITVPGWVGMRNSGNTCFLNSVVQLLSAATLFRRHLLWRVQQAVFPPPPIDGDSASSATHTASAGAAAAAAMAKVSDLAALFAKYGCRLAMVLLLGELQWRAQHHHEDFPVLPNYLDAQLPSPFNDHRQHDASEFLHALLDQLDEPAQPGGAVVGRWFSGTTATTMTCTRCRHSRTHVNAFWDVSTPIPQSASAVQVGDTHEGGGEAATARCTGATQQVVEVDHFPGATATTTTYLGADSSRGTAPPPYCTVSDTAVGAAPLDNDKEVTRAQATTHTHSGGRAAAQTSSPLVPLREWSSAAPGAVSHDATTHAHQQPHTLQHLLLHVLHPTLNKELLHDGNALDCEYCGRRTNTALTTRLVADVSAEEAAEVQRAETPSHCIPRASVLSVYAEDMSAGVALTASFDGADEDARTSGRVNTQQRNGNEEGKLQTAPRHDTTSLTQSSSSNSSNNNISNESAGTAAGGGLPYYLAVQLNRFAYQRATQSYGKVTDAVPLNEIVVVPVYPLKKTAAATTPPSSPSVESYARQPGSTKQPPHHEISSNDASSCSSPAKAIAAMPVWVAYRLHSFIVHSGSTPNSGHYFALARNPHKNHTPTVAVPTSVGDEEGESRGDFTGPARPTTATLEDDAVRAYVQEYGAALTLALDAGGVCSAFPHEGTAEAVMQAPSQQCPTRDKAGEPTSEHAGDREEDDIEEAAGRRRCSARAGAPLRASKSLPSNEEYSSLEDCATLESGADDVHQRCGTSVSSPLLPALPALPHAAVAVSGAAFYDGWVMLNDSNVQTVCSETMQRILCGDGGTGVYSSLETPYLMLYEKVPVSYVQRSGGGDVAETWRADANADSALARLLQRVWEHRRRETRASSAPPSSMLSPATVPLAPEVVKIFEARLHEEKARAHGAAPHTATTTTSRVAAPSSSSSAPAAAAPAAGVAQTPPRSKTHLLITSSAAALRSSKRLRAKVAAYAQQLHESKTPASRRRTQAANSPLCRGGDTAAEKAETEEKSAGKEDDGDTDASDGVSLD
jgi:ubiquitin carboxyl-terminal hydrolase 35/38